MTHAATTSSDPFVIAGREFSSRLLVGTGKYKDLEETGRAIEASGANIVTFAVRRTNLGQDPNQPSLLEVISPARYTMLPNTAGCYSADEAVRTLRLAREAGGWKMLTCAASAKSAVCVGLRSMLTRKAGRFAGVERWRL